MALDFWIGLAAAPLFAYQATGNGWVAALAGLFWYGTFTKGRCQGR